MLQIHFQIVYIVNRILALFRGYVCETGPDGKIFGFSVGAFLRRTTGPAQVTGKAAVRFYFELFLTNYIKG